eukprot:31499-Pelagococcus_subviridis.AAC.10
MSTALRAIVLAALVAQVAADCPKDVFQAVPPSVRLARARRATTRRSTLSSLRRSNLISARAPRAVPSRATDDD